MSIWSISLVTLVNSLILLVRFIVGIIPFFDPKFQNYLEFGYLRRTEWGKAIVVLLITFWETIPILTVLLIFGRIASVKTPVTTFSKEPEQLAPKSDFSVTRSWIEKYPKEERNGSIDTEDLNLTSVQSPSNSNFNSLASEGSFLGKTYYGPQGLMFKNAKYGTKDQKM